VLAQKQASDRNHTNPNTIIVTPNQEVVYELSKAKLVKKIVELPQILLILLIIRHLFIVMLL
jgi:hypothetical protein